MLNNDLLIVVDMQNAYLNGRPWACNNMNSCTSKIVQLLESSACPNVVFTKHMKNGSPIGTWTEYNLAYYHINEDNKNAMLIDAIVPYTLHHPVFEKTTYSAFSCDALREMAKRADRVVLCGVVGECCILSTMMSGIDLGIRIVYLKDAIASSTPEFSSSIEKIAESFSPVHTTVMTVEEYIGDADFPNMIFSTD